MRRRGGFRVGIVAGLLMFSALAGWALQRQSAQGALARGEAVYTGALPLPGRLAGHETALPTLATRCVNCHAAGSAEGAGRDGAARFGASLDAAALTALRSRRGGPRSRFDAATLCEVLRSGRDPVQVLISSNMPRYDVTEAQCRDLWNYLASR